MKQSKLVKVTALFLGLSFFLGEGLNYSQLGPFFPTEASEHKGVSTTLIGVITGAFDVANFLAAFTLASFISPETQKFFFCTGALISASCNGLFGVMGYSVGGVPFIVVCTLVRALMGVGASMVWSTGVPLLVPIYPQWSGRITSLIETSIGLGLMIGPTIGSALYSLGGYSTPFLVAAATQILFAVMCIFFLPNKATELDNKQTVKTTSEHPEESDVMLDFELPGYTFLYFATRPSLIGVSLPVLGHSASMGFIDVAIGPYLKETFGVGGDIAGYYFLAYSGFYALSAPLLGLLIDRGHAGRILLISCFCGALSYALLWLPDIVPSLQSKYWLIACLMFVGIANAGGFTSIYLIFEKLAYAVGFRVENNVKLMTAALLNACFASGRMLGPIVVGGVFMDHFGYYYSCLLMGCLFLGSSVSTCYVLFTRRLLKRVFYPQQADCERDVIVKYESVVETLHVSSGGGVSGGTVTSTKSQVAPSDYLVQSARYNPIALSLKLSGRTDYSTKRT